MLTPSQVAQYNTQGYCVVENLLSDEEVARFNGEIDALSAGSTLANHDSSRLEMEPNQSADGAKVRRIYEPSTHYDLFREFSGSKKLVDCLEQLIGSNIMYFSSKVNVKAAEIGSMVEWHQDMAFGPLTNRSSLAMLLYLDAADRENGCLQVLAGEHAMYDHSREGLFQGRITEAIDTSKAIPVEARAGAGIFFSGLTPHASAPNRSSRSRRTLILSYRAADAFPVYLAENGTKGEAYLRLVRGQTSNVARFDMQSVYVPRYPRQTTSIFDLQGLSRQQQEAVQ